MTAHRTRSITHAGRFRTAAIAIAIGAAAACSSPTSPSTPPTAPYSQTDLVVGAGTTVVSGNAATVSYTGWLYDPTKTDGKGTQFDSSPSFPFVVGVGQVIPGWDQGVPGMRVGGQRRLVLPPSLAYGSRASSKIPANSTLVFDIGLLSVP